MALFEVRTYTFYVGKLSEAVELYKAEGWPALQKHAPNHLVGYFVGDVGALNELVHLWKFEDDADRRRFLAGVFADETFMNFAKKLRPLIRKQQNKLLLEAPWGPHP